MPKFILRKGVGTHVTTLPNGKTVTYKAGDVVEDRFDLTKTFVNKFDYAYEGLIPSKGEPVGGMTALESEAERLAKLSKDQFHDLSSAPKQPVTPTGDEDDDNDDTGPDGKEVTDRFPKAKEEDYKVFKNGKLYFVYDADTNQQINADGVNKAGVNTVIDDALKAK